MPEEDNDMRKVFVVLLRDPEKAGRVMQAMLQVDKIDIENFEECLPGFPASFWTERGNLSVIMRRPGRRPLAFSRRITAGYRRNQGRWQIVHEHASVRLQPGNIPGLVALVTKP